jgi:hypothetical protein
MSLSKESLSIALVARDAIVIPAKPVLAKAGRTSLIRACSSLGSHAPITPR